MRGAIAKTIGPFTAVGGALPRRRLTINMPAGSTPFPVSFWLICKCHNVLYRTIVCSDAFFAAAPRFAALRRRPSSGAHPSPAPPLTVSSLFFLTALIAALLVVMSLICSFCLYDLATNQRELGQHVRYCGAATSGGGDGGGGASGGGGGGGGGGGDGGASYDAGAAMDTSQVLSGSANASLLDASVVEEFDWEGGGAISDGGGADDESTGTGTGADNESAGTGMNCSASTGSFESAAAPAPPPAAPMAPAAAPGGGAGSQRGRDLATSALGVLAGTTVAELGAGVDGGLGKYVLSVRQTVPDVALDGGFRGSIAGSILTATVDSHRFNVDARNIQEMNWGRGRKREWGLEGKSGSNKNSTMRYARVHGSPKVTYRFAL